MDRYRISQVTERAGTPATTPYPPVGPGGVTRDARALPQGAYR